MDRPGVLQVEGRGQPGLIHQAQEEIKVPVFEGCGLQRRGTVVVVEVHSPEYRPVAARLAQGGNGGAEVCYGHIPQDGLAEVGRDRAHLTGDVGIIVRQIPMAGAGVHDAQGIAGAGKVILDFVHHRGGGVGKVDGYRTAHRGTHLVHQAGRLAEIDVFGVLADFGDFNGVQCAVAAKVV